MTTGVVNAQQTITNSLSVTSENVSIAGQSLHDYIASVVNEVLGGTVISPVSSIDTIDTHVISPLDQSAISVKLENNKLSIINGKSGTGSAVATFDREGNATLSGSLSVGQDASIAGTLHASKIIADTIEGLNVNASTVSANYITNVTNIYNNNGSNFPTIDASASGTGNPGLFDQLFNGSKNYISIASFSSQLAYVANLGATNLSVAQGLTVYGPTSLSDTSVVGQLSIDGQLILSQNSINTLGTDLNLQPLRQGGLSIMAGLIYIDSNGNATFNSDLTVKGNLYARNISPVDGGDLSLVLGTASASFNVKGSSSSAILSVNQTGDLTASGAATFGKLNLASANSGVTVVSPTEVIASSSAGTITLTANNYQVKVDNPLVTDKSLIYITPVGDTLGKNLYLSDQVSGSSFTAKISSPIPNDIKFNYLIIN